MNLNLGSVSANTLELGYTGTYTGGTSPGITDVNTDEAVYPGQAFDITGTNFGATQGTGGVDVDGVEYTVNTWSDTVINATAVRGGNEYGTGKTLTVTTDAATTATITVAQEAEPNTFAVTAASPNTTDDASLWTGLVDTATGDPITIVDGDQAWVKNPNNLTNLAVAPDGEITADVEGDFVVQIWLLSEGVWGSDQTVTFEVPVNTTPDQFTFTDQTDVALSTQVESNIITVTGVDSGTDIPVSITGGEYAVSTDGGSTFGAYTSANTNVQLNYQIKVRHTTSATNSTTTDTTLDVGGVTDTFTTTTVSADTTPDPFTVSPLTNQPLNEYVEFEAIEVTGVDAGADVPVSVTGAEYAVDAGSGYGAFTSTGTNAQLGYFVKPRILTSSSHETETTGSIDIGGETSTLSATTVPPVIKRTGKQRAMVEQAKSQMRTLPPKPSNTIIVEE